MKRLALIGLIAALFAPFSPAQRELEPPPGRVRPGLEPGKVSLQFPDNPVSDILGIYEKLTGRTVLKDSRVFSGAMISLVTPGEISRDEAVKLIEASLGVNGYVLVDDQATGAVRIFPKSAESAVMNQSLRVLTDPAHLPTSERLVSFFMRLEHLDAIEAATLVSNHIGLSAFGRITPVLDPQGLLATDTSAVIRRMLDLRTIIDVPAVKAGPTTRFISLKHAEAAVVAQIVQAALKSRPEYRGLSADTVTAEGRRNQPDGHEPPDPQVVADDRLNRIMVIAGPEDHLYVSRLISEFDQPLQPGKPYERRLFYAYVDEVLPVLVDVLRDTGTGTTTLPGGGSVTTRQMPRTSQQLSALTGRVRQSTVSNTPAPAAPPPPTSAGQGKEDVLVQPLENTAPISVSVGKTRIVADILANAIIATGPKESLGIIDDMIDRLDRKPPQVYLATVIGQLSLDDNMKFGVEYLQRFKSVDNKLLDGVAGSLINRESIRRAVPDARNQLATSALENATGLNLYGQLGGSLDAFVTALEATQRFKILSRPAVYATNNRKAVITSGQRIPVPTSSVADLSSRNSTAVRTNIEFQDVVLKLEVIPLINKAGEVTLTIAQINDTVIGSQLVADNEVPIIGTERLVTSVTVPDRRTVVLGGLISEKQEKQTSGVPFVSRIPVLGHAFKTTSNGSVRRELLIFIQPTVVEDASGTLPASEDERARTRLGQEAFEAFPDTPPAPAEPEMQPVAREVPAAGKAKPAPKRKRVSGRR